MPDIFLKLVNMSLSASVLVLVVAGLRFLLKKAPKWIICCLWAMVAIRLLCPFSFESVFSLMPQAVSSGEAVADVAGTYVEDHNIYQNTTDQYQIAVNAGREPVYIGNGHYYVVTGSDGISEPATVETAVIPILCNFWLVGLAVMMLYAVISYLRLRRKVAPSICLRDNIYLCDYIDTPFILGVIRPNIYLPSTLNESQWPHVVAHEHAHLKRRDHWWKPLGFVLLCIHWFNPLLWLAYILLCRDIELACDEKVIKELGTQDKQAYSEALLECSMPRYLIAACPLAFGEVGVKARVKSILNYKKPAFWVVLIALILCVAAAVCFLTDPLGSGSIVPGTYTFDQPIYWEQNVDGGLVPTIPDGVYTLDEGNTLYWRSEGQVHALGQMSAYDLDNRELSGYLGRDDAWQVSSHHLPTVTDALWLRMEDQSFYLFFQTADANTYLARGWEDYGERGTDSDDTRITHLCQMILREEVILEDMTYFAGTVIEVQDTSILVQADDNALFPYRVSLYWHAYDEVSGLAVDGEFPAPEVGDRVMVTYDGTTELIHGERVIRDIFGIQVLETTKVPCTVLSANQSITPLVYPKGTDITAVTEQLPLLKLFPENNNQFTVLYDGISLGSFRLYDYWTREEIKGFSSLTEGTNWDLLAPGRNYIVTAEYNGLLCFAVSVPHDFGITLTARNISPTGVTIDCVQSGSTCPGPFMYGEYYRLERFTGEKWVELQYLEGTNGGTFFTMAYALRQNESTSWRFNWQSLYGELEPGQYRLVRYFSYGNDWSSDYHNLPFYADFVIQDEAASTDPSLQCEISIELLDATATEGVVAYHIRNLGDATVWAGYEYHLEVLTDTGWVHYGYPPEDLAWETAFLFISDQNNQESAQDIVIHEENWSRVADAPLPPGTYRYCKSIALEKDGRTTGQTYYAEFTVSEETPENWGLHLEVLNPTDTGATLALTYQGGLRSELSTKGKYYLMVDVGNGATTYGLLPDQVAWDDVLYSLAEGETIYLDVRWDHTADAPLPLGTYYVVLEIDQYLPYGSDSGVHMTQYITASFAVIE